MTAFLQGLLIVITIAGSVTVLVRWALPVALRLALDLLEDAVGILAAILLLPEYWVSRAVRARGAAPPQLAYDYGEMVAGTARHAQLALRRICRGLILMARTLPPAVVAAITTAVQIILLLR